MTVESTIDYEGLAQEAMRGVVRKVLAGTAKSGLAGDHHFYISFDTEAPGVSLSRRLKEKYPQEMTIVLQHRFWDLAVSEDRFEVKLTFDGIPERLVVPFEAIKVFFDPSVRFGLQFEDPGNGPEARTQQAGNAFENLAARSGATRAGTRKAPRASRSKSQANERVGKPAAADASAPVAGEARPMADDAAQSAATPFSAANAGARRAAEEKRAAAAEDKGAAAVEETASSNDKEAPVKPGGAEIVSLDKFRKK